MQLTVYETIPKNINLSKQQMKEVTIQYLKELVHPGEYIREIDGDTYVMMDDDHYHGSISEIRVRPASDLDIQVFNMLTLLRKVGA